MNVKRKALECILYGPEWQDRLALFFSDLTKIGDTEFFSPHEITEETLNNLADYDGQDLYYLIVENEKILGYGLLRGWDEGYEIPSLGIAIHPAGRQSGLATLFMNLLHLAAARNGAKKVRLRVHKDNIKAKQLYIKLGYVFEHAVETDEYLVGYKDLI